MENNVFFILKNKDKFSNIKLSKGIILEECQRKELSTQILGASIDARYFYIINNKQALFKSYCSKRYTNIKHNRIINEMLCYYLAQQVGLKCAKYEPATLGDISGLISYNVLEKNEQLCDFFSFSCNLEDFTVSIERIMYYTMQRTHITLTNNKLKKICLN